MVAPSCSAQLGKATGSTVRTLVGRNAPLTNIRAHLPSRSLLAAAAAPTTPVASHTRPLSISATSAFQPSTSSADSSAAPAPGPSRSKRSTIPPDALELKADQLDAAPTLEYLDSLKPKRKPTSTSRSPTQGSGANSSGSGNRFGKRGDPNDATEVRQWNKTRDAIAASFTRDQLAKLAREAGLTGSYSAKVKKEELVRRILVQRFQMEDVAQRNERLRNEEREKVNLYMPFEPAQLFLVLTAGAATVRNEASKRQVTILAQPPTSAEGALGFWVRGKAPDTLSMRAWADEFKQKISEKLDHVHLPASTSSAAASTPPLSPGLVRFISRSSRCFIEVLPSSSSTVLDLRLQFLDASDGERATSMLRHYFSECRAAVDRLSSAVYSDDLSALRQYSLLPFAASHPVPWICQAQDAARTGVRAGGELTFRASLVPDYDMIAAPPLAPGGGEAELPRIRAWKAGGQMEMQEVFSNLLGLSSRSAILAGSDEGGIVHTFSATFGHVLYSAELPHDASSTSTSTSAGEHADALCSPRPGLWPLAHLLDHLSALRLSGDVDEAGKRFLPTSLFRLQKGTSSASWLERNGWTMSATHEEVHVLSYSDERAEDAERRTLHVEIGHDGNVQRAAWRGNGETDLMLPEKPYDLRLATHTDRLLSIDAMTISRPLRSFSEGLAAGERTIPPSRIDLIASSEGGTDASREQTLVLDSSIRVIRQRWTRDAVPSGASQDEQVGSVGGADVDATQGSTPQAGQDDAPPGEDRLELIREVVGEEHAPGYREVMRLQWTSPTPPPWSSVTAEMDALLARNSSRPVRP